MDPNPIFAKISPARTLALPVAPPLTAMGATLSAKATRKTHSVHSFPRRRVLIPFDRSFTAEEFERVKLGVVPREMEDHWSIFLENGWLYFVRSWTGYCVYKGRVEQKNDTARITEAWASRDPCQYKSTDPKYDAELLAEVIERVLLNPENPN